MRIAYVTCPLCGEEHPINKVECLDIEEDMSGRDKLTFTCPVKNEPATALVWAR